MIDLFVTDLDGCLTDGLYVVDRLGRVSKTFYTRDFHGIDKIIDSGVYVVILTSSDSDCDRHKITEFIDKKFKGNNDYPGPAKIRFFQNITNKKQFIEEFISRSSISWDNIAYIGDDEIDIELLTSVGIAACPLDAEPCVIDVVSNLPGGIVLNKPGGKGCVREFINVILDMRKHVFD